MPKIKSRNVNTLPYEFLAVADKEDAQPFGEPIDNAVDCGDPFTEPMSYYPRPDSDTESLTLDLNKLSGFSSSSSLSWSDEYYENESSKKVYDELRRIDRVFRGEEEVPPQYDKEEFALWTKLFPNLSIFDPQKTPVNSVPDIVGKVDEEINCRCNCDKITSNPNKEEKLAVIDFVDSGPKLLTLRSPNVRKRRNMEEGKVFLVSNEPRVLDTDKFLKISSLQHRVNERKPSSRSLMSRQVSREATEDFNSLPFIKSEVVLSRNSNFTPEKKKLDRLVLPPIITDQFRSVSALPRQNYKTLSALSMNMRAVKSKRKGSKDFLLNPVTSRTEKNEFLL